MTKSRREFLIQSGAALTAAAALAGNPFRLDANPLGLPIGLQLYTVKDELAKDYDGTLAQVAAVGYKEVELAGFFGKKPAEIKASLDKAGLHCGSIHIPASDQLAEAIDYAKVIGAKYVISSVLLPKRLTEAGTKPDWDTMITKLKAVTLDDYKSIAEQCNQMGAQAKQAGLQFGYHNHTMEFRDLGGSIGYDVLLKDTDPAYVTLELDCGWVTAAGKDPIAYLTQYPGRISMLHIKDLKPAEAGKAPGERVSTVLGKGTIDYKPIFAAAKKAGIKHYFVEQEAFDGDPLQELKEDYEYLHAIHD